MRNHTIVPPRRGSSTWLPLRLNPHFLRVWLQYADLFAFFGFGFARQTFAAKEGRHGDLPLREWKRKTALLSIQQFIQKFACLRFPRPCNFLRCAFHYHITASLSSLWSQIYNPVRTFNYIKVMLNNNH